MNTTKKSVTDSQNTPAQTARIVAVLAACHKATIHTALVEALREENNKPGPARGLLDVAIGAALDRCDALERNITARVYLAAQELPGWRLPHLERFGRDGWGVIGCYGKHATTVLEYRDAVAYLRANARQLAGL